MLQNLDQIYSRNVHILYSAQDNYISPERNQKRFAMLDADEEGNLYRIGKIMQILIFIRNWFNSGSGIQAMNVRVARAIERTINGLTEHLNNLSTYFDQHEQELKDSASALSDFNRKLYITPNRGFKVVRVNYESPFFLNLARIQDIEYEYIYFGKLLTHPYKSIDQLEKKFNTMLKVYVSLEERIVRINPEYSIINYLQLPKNNFKLNLTIDDIRARAREVNNF